MSSRFPALLLLFAASAFGLAGSPSDLIQPKIKSEMAKAERALEAGDAGLAEAIGALVRPEAVTVAVDLTRMPFDQRHECLRAASLAMEMWEEALDGAVHFEVAPASMAQVRLRYQPEVYMAGARVAGKAIISRATHSWGWGSYGSHLSATLEVRGQSLESMASTTAHELGHVLGLTDSGSRSGVMGAMVDPGVLKTPSAEEATALLALFHAAEQVSLRAQSFRARTRAQ